MLAAVEDPTSNVSLTARLYSVEGECESVRECERVGRESVRECESVGEKSVTEGGGESGRGCGRKV